MHERAACACFGVVARVGMSLSRRSPTRSDRDAQRSWDHLLAGTKQTANLNAVHFAASPRSVPCRMQFPGVTAVSPNPKKLRCREASEL
jgi:hypothetical protein